MHAIHLRNRYYSTVATTGDENGVLICMQAFQNRILLQLSFFSGWFFFFLKIVRRMTGLLCSHRYRYAWKVVLKTSSKLNNTHRHMHTIVGSLVGWENLASVVSKAIEPFWLSFPIAHNDLTEYARTYQNTGSIKMYQNSRSAGMAMPWCYGYRLSKTLFNHLASEIAILNSYSHDKRRPCVEK